jgi:hypothetical protein
MTYYIYEGEINMLEKKESKMIEELIEGHKLSDMKPWVDLLNLDKKSVEKIKRLIKADREFDKNILIKLGITPEQKQVLLNNYPLEIFNYKKLITGFDIFKKVITDRAHIELDYEEIMEIANQTKPKTDWIKHDDGTREPVVSSPIDDILNDPKINIDLEKPEIRATYKAPLNKQVIFTPGNIEVV